MNEKNWVKRYFLAVIHPFLPTVVAAIVAVYIVLYTIVFPAGKAAINNELPMWPLGIVITVAVATWYIHFYVNKRFITRVSDFPGRTHLLYEDANGKVHPGGAFWAKVNVAAITLPNIDNNVFRTTVRLEQKKTRYKQLTHSGSIDVDLFFMVRDRSDSSLPHGFDPEELYRRMVYRDSQLDVAQWLGGIFVSVVMVDPMISKIFEHWDENADPLDVFRDVVAALSTMAVRRGMMPRQSSNIWKMTAIVKVPQDGNVVRFDLDKSHSLPGDKPSAEQRT